MRYALYVISKELLYGATALLVILYILEKWQPGMALMQMRIGVVFVVAVFCMIVLFVTENFKENIQK